MVKCISLDPGITTGYSLGIITKDVFQVSCDENKLDHSSLWFLLKEFKPDWIVCESFEFRNDPTIDNLEYYGIELIGVAQLYYALDIDCRLRMQTASQGKGHYNDTKLKKMNLYVPGKTHGRDALRHMLHWFTFMEGFQFNAKQQILLARTETLLEKAET